MCLYHLMLWAKRHRIKNPKAVESKTDTNELIYKTENRLTDLENKLMVTKGKRCGGGEG